MIHLDDDFDLDKAQQYSAEQWKREKRFRVAMLVVMLLSGIICVWAILGIKVHAQSRTYTNADLGKPVTWSAPAPSAETLAGLQARQFQAPVSFPREPRDGSTLSTGPTLGPWAWPDPRPDRRLDGTLLTDPPAFYMSTYLGHGRNINRPTPRPKDR